MEGEDRPASCIWHVSFPTWGVAKHSCYFPQLRQGEVRRISIPRTRVNSPCATLRAPDLARSRAHLGSGPFNERSDDIRPRHVDCVAARGLLNGHPRSLRHPALELRGDHPVLGRDEVPAWL